MPCPNCNNTCLVDSPGPLDGSQDKKIDPIDGCDNTDPFVHYRDNAFDTLLPMFNDSDFMMAECNVEPSQLTVSPGSMQVSATCSDDAGLRGDNIKTSLEAILTPGIGFPATTPITTTLTNINMVFGPCAICKKISKNESDAK